MPYNSNEDLPKQAKDNLPKHAQDIYREAYNHAEKEYQDPEKRRGNASKEETAHKVAWSAVKKEYHKEGDTWKRDKD